MVNAAQHNMVRDNPIRRWLDGETVPFHGGVDGPGRKGVAGLDFVMYPSGPHATTAPPSGPSKVTCFAVPYPCLPGQKAYIPVYR